MTSVLLAFHLLCAAVHAVPGAEKVRLSLEPDLPELVRGGETGISVWADIERGWHINANKPTDAFLIPTELTLSVPEGITVDPPNYPKPDRKTFAFAAGKELLVYEGKVGVMTALTVPAAFSGTRIRIEASLRYQACNDTTCLPPRSATAEVTLPVRMAIGPGARDGSAPGTLGGAGVASDVGASIAGRGMAMTLLLVMLLGLGLNLTPCVYPLISVTVAYFGRQGQHRSVRVALLATVYVLGITASFAAVGVTAALSGGVFGAALQQPAVLVFLAAVLVALALSCFGLYQLQPPAAVMRRVSGSTQGYAGALFMGLTMGIVAAPCVGPVVIGLLVYVSSQQSVWLGLQLFFALGLGMGMPYLGLAMAAGALKTLPRSGAWMVWIERVFGFLLLGMAAHFISPLVPVPFDRLLLPGVLVVAGLYLGFIDRSGQRMPRFQTVQRVSGIAALLLAVWWVAPPRAESAIRWQPLESTSLAAARTAGQPAIVDFVAEWCIPCREMDRTTYVHPEVQQQAERFAMLKADITRENDATSALVEEHRVLGVPTVIFVDRQGDEVQRLVGYVGAEEMLSVMRTIE